MKVTNISTASVFLRDLAVMRAAQNEGRRGESQYVLAGTSVYLPNTSEVMRSAKSGDLSVYRDQGRVTLEDTESLAANGAPGDSVVLTHNFGYPQAVFVLKQVGNTWVDATGTYDAIQNDDFTTVTITNTTAFAMVFSIRFL